MISINLIKAAETGGTLETTLADIVKASNKEAVFSDQLRNTMIYPAFVMVVFTGIIILMLTFVLPRVSEVFSSLNVNMPWITRAMIKISQVFIARWKLIVSIIVIFIVGLILLIRANKKRMMRLILRIPFLRKLGTNIDLTRFNRSFGLLMRAGVPIMEALNLAERVVSKKEITAVIEQMKKDISNGKPLADSLDVSDHVVPAIMARSIKTAESTGTLDETLQNLTDYFDEQVAQTLKVLSSLIEPLMIVVVGVLVGFLMIAIIVPIYSMISQINSLPKPQ
jgi:type II secretory pathway component PulF